MDDEDVVILPTRPINAAEKLLREKFAASIAEQSDLMDKLAHQLITLELAIPGLYATILKMTAGADAKLTANPYLIGAFVCWSLALALTIIALIPRDYKVDPTMLKSDPAGRSQKLSIEEFFRKSAIYKRRLLLPSIIIFFIGIISAALSLF